MKIKESEKDWVAIVVSTQNKSSPFHKIWYTVYRGQ